MVATTKYSYWVLHWNVARANWDKSNVKHTLDFEDLIEKNIKYYIFILIPC